MSVWLCVPAKRSWSEGTLSVWKDQGYSVAVIREVLDGGLPVDFAMWTESYQGWARSTNLVIGAVMAAYTDAEWLIAAGDDYLPDPHRRAEDIAAECSEHFANLHRDNYGNDTFGVMQPTGGRWGEGRCTTCSGIGWTIAVSLANPSTDNPRIECPDCQGSGHSAVIDRICGSPWMGREFCRRMYHGAGPMYNGYFHNFADEELQNVARKLGVLWQRRDIVQEHRHWATKQPHSSTHTGLAGDVRNMPEWARKINDPKESDWERSKALFAKRKAAGFPGHEPLEF